MTTEMELKEQGYSEVSLKQAMNHNGPIYLFDSRCRNIVEARLFSVKHRPRLGRYDVTYKVALWWRSFQTTNIDMGGLYIKDN